MFGRYELMVHQTVDVKEFRELFDCPSSNTCKYIFEILILFQTFESKSSPFLILNVNFDLQL
jgi:hypothetical protein